ncbi:zinc finger protein 385D-like isoform X1 [Sinocyclocheilus rhinocerous]|uniref:zinc finger protein 385D-like isoform X1 n=1 Tax=Sinocyclocheilus rhinocerous TaxID=307959 RepID=UPI0007B97883|nr:PREDICTED: zinc finger protein 385D-like isoform X1 [Sinocyclocheilus rhinocerous]
MLGSADHGETRKRNGTGMKRPLSPVEDGSLTEQTGHEGVSSEGVEFTRREAPPINSRPKRERKHRSYTLCEVCNIQLNSAAQAQIHYNGKTHQKRLKHINNNNTGTAAQGSPLLASLPVQGRPLQTPLDLKHFLPFRLSGSSPLNLFPNFNTMDPVQKAVINHTFGVPQSLKKKQVISCNICHLRFNSTNQAEAHYKGHKHARKLKALETQKNKQQRRQLDNAHHNRDREKDRERDRERDSNRVKTSAPDPLPALLDDTAMEETAACDSDPVARVDDAHSSSVVLTPISEVSSADLSVSSPHFQNPDGLLEPTGATSEPAAQQDNPTGDTPAEKDPKKTKQHLHCPICKVTVNSTTQMDAHNSGTKHKLMMEGQSVLPRRRGKAMSSRPSCKSKRLASKGSVGVASKSFYCEVCEIHVNSEAQLSQHMNSRRHKDRLSGKPPKPKFSPHAKSQLTSAASQGVRWNGYAGGAVSAMKKIINQYNLSSLSSQTKLVLQKQLTKNLTASFLPTPLTTPTLCTVAANPLALRHPPGTTFIQTPILGPALFRPAPGPLRATHTPIIFSPY